MTLETIEAAALWAVEATACDDSVYYSLNPIQDDERRASKETVVRRHWLLIDIDTIRPSKDDSATEAEKAKALEVATRIVTSLPALGWPAPLVVDSGNGWHLLFRIDLPNDKESARLIKGVLHCLADRFDTEHAKVDRAVYDAPRIAKLPGTRARKGPDTPDRPHRIAKIVFEPETIEVVSRELLEALVDTREQVTSTEPSAIQSTGHMPPWKTEKANGNGRALYVRKAIEQECLRVALAPEGERNNALNRAAFSLGQLAGCPEMDEAQVKNLLVHSARRAGLSEHETALTIDSGWEAGRNEPRDLSHVGNGKHGGDGTAPPAPSKDGPNPLLAGEDQHRIMPVLIKASTIETKPIDWLWKPRVPLGMPTLLFGYGGVGKGLILADLAARTSAGLPRPDDRESSREPADVIVLTAEESYSRVYVPRLIACDADLDRVHLYPHNRAKDGSVVAFTLQNLAPLALALKSVPQPGLLIIDPPSAYLGSADDHREAEVRAILAPLQQLIEEFNVGLLMVKHLNKSEGRNPLSRVSGSVAWVNAARVSWYVGRDPDNPALRLMVRHKVNIVKDPPGLRFSIENCPTIEGEPGRVVWDANPVNLAAEDVIDKDYTQEPGEIERAKQFLDTHVTVGGILAAELYTLAESEGIGERTLKRARNRDKTIDVCQIERRWWWRRIAAEAMPDPGKPF